MKIGIKPNLTRENAYNVTKGVFNELKDSGVSILFSDEFEKELDFPGAVFSPDESLYSECDIIIAIGGDGTIIHCAHECAKFGTKVLGINAGRLAFMAGIEERELFLLHKLVCGEYETERRMLLSVDLFDSEKLVNSSYCINDAVIARGDSLKMCDIRVTCDGKAVNDYYADGIIVSTPTGSTAYALSAGGPIMDPTIESLSVTPICTHSLFFSRPLIFKPTSVIEVSVKNAESVRPILSCDGESEIKLCPNSRIIIKKAEISAEFVRVKPDNFVDILSQKLAQKGHETELYRDEKKYQT